MKYKFCPNCGYKLEDSFVYCPKCGYKVGELSTDSHLSPEPIREQRVENTIEEQNIPLQTKKESTLDLGVRLFQEEKYEQALSYLLDNATADNVEVLYMLGYSYFQLDFHDPNAEKLLKIAADQGFVLAQKALGQLYYALAEEFNVEGLDGPYNPRYGYSPEFYEAAKEKCSIYYKLALKYINMAKNNG